MVKFSISYNLYCINILLQGKISRQNKIYFQGENPSGSDLNALGLYMMSCLIFVVCALIEFAIVVLVSRSSASLKKKLEKSNAENREHLVVTETLRPRWNNGETINEPTERERTVEQLPSLARSLMDKVFPHINTIDLYAFFVYFCLFLLFNCGYWQKYLAK